jgi:integrase
MQPSTHARYAWEVIVPASTFGKRIRRRFNDRDLAEAELADLRHRASSPGIAITRDESLFVGRWRYKLTLAEQEAALTTTLARKAGASVPLSRVCNEYMNSIDRAHRAGRVGDLHARDVELLTPKLSAGPLGWLATDALSRADIQEWVDSMSHYTAETRRNRLRNLTAVLNHAVRTGIISSNPASGIGVGGDKPKVGIVKPNELRALLRAAEAHPDTYWWLVFGAFAGLRTSEVARLDWSDVQPTEDFDDEVGAVYVSPGKTDAAERWVHFTAPLEGFSWPSKPSSGPVLVLTPAAWQAQRRLVYDIAGVKVPNNGLRHSFASHHLVAFTEPHQTAAEMGHTTPKTTFAHYRRAVSPEQATDYWATNFEKKTLDFA